MPGNYIFQISCEDLCTQNISPKLTNLISFLDLKLFEFIFMCISYNISTQKMWKWEMRNCIILHILTTLVPRAPFLWILNIKSIMLCILRCRAKLGILYEYFNSTKKDLFLFYVLILHQQYKPMVHEKLYPPPMYNSNS